MALRIHGDTRNFAKIEVGWEVQEIGHRVVLNFGRRGRLCRERTGRMRNYQQQEIRRELHFHSSLGTRFKSPATQPRGPSHLEEANVEVLNTQAWLQPLTVKISSRSLSGSFPETVWLQDP